MSEEAKHCPVCGEAFLPFPGMEASDIVEVEMQAHMRRIERQRYQKGCECSQVPGLITAPPAPRLIPKSPLGVSVWCHVLLDTYLYGPPTHRLCQELSHHGLPLAQGTVTDGLQKLAALFEPLMPMLRERQMGERLFHDDETRWEVYEEIDGKVGHRWYLWVMQSASVVYDRMAPGRGAHVLKAHCDGLHRAVVEVVLVCDRFRAYQSFAKSSNAIILAYCWAHVRRDCIGAARSWPDLASWMFVWVEDMRELYRLNKARREVGDRTLPLTQQSSACAQSPGVLEGKLREMQARCAVHFQEPDLPRAKTKVLSSLHTHWDGLTVFRARPEVALDTNAAERALRGPVVRRKNS